MSQQQSFLIEQPIPQLMKVRELPAGMHPINRLQDRGEKALSDAELVAAVINTPSAISVGQLMLQRFGGLQGVAKAITEELADLPEVGVTKATQLKAALELGRRLTIEGPERRPQIEAPANAANLIMSDMGLLEREQLWVLILNTKNYVLKIETVYKGSVNASMVRVAELFRTAIRMQASAIIVAHNHPSGDPTPSPEDVRVTHQIVDAGKLLDIQVLDHLVIGHQRFVSMKERGIGF